MIRRRVLIGCSACEVLCRHLTETGCSLAQNLLGTVPESLLTFSARIGGLDRLLNHRIQRSATTEQREGPWQLPLRRRNLFGVEARAVISREGRGQKEDFRGVLAPQSPMRGFDRSVEGVGFQMTIH